MKSSRHPIVRTIFVLAFLSTALAVDIGDPAPNFAIVNSHDKTVRLSDYKGKYVVLEWHSAGCSFVKKQYETGNMQRLQKDWTAKGVVWLMVISSAPGTPGFMTLTQANAYVQQVNASPTAVLMDMGGTLGRLYGARTTPAMFVIDNHGNLIYQGAIDDHPKLESWTPEKAKNYVSAALEESMAGKPVTVPETQPYGCSVKYK